MYAAAEMELVNIGSEISHTKNVLQSEISHTQKDNFIITFNDRVLLCNHSWPGMYYIEQLVLSLQRSSCLCFSHAGVKGVCHHTPKRQVLMLTFIQSAQSRWVHRDREELG